MNTELEKVITEQATKLPKEIRSFFASSDWDVALDAIIDQFAIPEAVRGAFRNEVLIVLLGLMHPDAFRSEIAKTLLTRAETIDAITAQVEQKIFAPIRPALVAFFESEQAAAEVRGEFADEKAPTTATPASAGTAPENLPTAREEAPFLPPLTPKVPREVHPFEEKMQAALTSASAGSASAMPQMFVPGTSQIPVEVTSAEPTPAPVAAAPAPTPSTPVGGTLAHDPYREPIE